MLIAVGLILKVILSTGPSSKAVEYFSTLVIYQHDQNQYLYHYILDPSFSTDKFNDLIGKYQIPYWIAHQAFINLAGKESCEDWQIRLSLFMYIESIGKFNETLPGIFRDIFARRPTKNMAVEFFNLIQALGEEYGSCIGADIGRMAIMELIDETDLYGVCIKAMTEAAWFGVEDLGNLVYAKNKVDELLTDQLKRLVVDEVSAIKFIDRLEEIGPTMNPALKWILDQPFATVEVIYTILDTVTIEDNYIVFDLLDDDRANFDWLKHFKLEYHEATPERGDQAVDRIIQIIKRDYDEVPLISYLQGLSLDYCPYSIDILHRVLVELPHLAWPPAEFFLRDLSLVKRKSTEIYFLLEYLEAYMNRMDELEIDSVLEFAFTSRAAVLSGSQSNNWNEFMRNVLRAVHSKNQNVLMLAKTDFNCVLSVNSDVTDLIAMNHNTNFLNSLRFLHTFHTGLSEDEQLKYIEETTLGKYEMVFLMLTDPEIGSTYNALLEKLDPEWSFFENARRLYSPVLADMRSQSAKVALMHQKIWEKYSKNTLGRSSILTESTAQELLDFLGNKSLVEDHWMVSDMAVMLLDFHERLPLPISQASIDSLRIAAAARPDKKRKREADKVAENEPEPKRHRPN